MTETERTAKAYVDSFDRLKTTIVESIVKDIRQTGRLYKGTPPNRLSDVTGQLSFLHATFHDIVANSFRTSLEGMSTFMNDKMMNDLLKGERGAKFDGSGGGLDRGLDS